MKQSLAQQIAITWELCGGREITDMAMNSMKEALEDFDPKAVERALIRCQTECRGNISLADIVSRIDDGRPGPEEAWAMIPKSEDESTVWTAEMAEAYGIIKDMMDDLIAARMAFREAYQRICGEARSARRPIEWGWSPGIDENFRARTLLEAVEKGRFSASRALSLAPHLIGEELEKRGLMLAQRKAPKMLSKKNVVNDNEDLVPSEEIKTFINKISTVIDLQEAANDELRQAEIRRIEKEKEEKENRIKDHLQKCEMFEKILKEGTEPESIMEIARNYLGKNSKDEVFGR